MFVDGSCNAAYRHHSFQFDLNTENCSLLNALKKSLHLSRRKTCFAHPVLENFFFVYRGVSSETANRSSIPSNSFMRDNSNIPLPIAVLQQSLGLFSMRSTRLKIVFMFMPDILKYTPFRFFESHTYHGRKKRAAPNGTALRIEYSVLHPQHRRSVLLLLHQKFQAVIQNLLLALGQHGQIEFTLDRQQFRDTFEKVMERIEVDS